MMTGFRLGVPSRFACCHTAQTVIRGYIHKYNDPPVRTDGVGHRCLLLGSAAHLLESHPKCSVEAAALVNMSLSDSGAVLRLHACTTGEVKIQDPDQELSVHAWRSHGSFDLSCFSLQGMR